MGQLPVARSSSIPEKCILWSRLPHQMGPTYKERTTHGPYLSQIRHYTSFPACQSKYMEKDDRRGSDSFLPAASPRGSHMNCPFTQSSWMRP
jgi:hypothetical protein